MFCPECGAEFVAGIERCADCDVILVNEPPPEPPHEAPDYETVLETSDVSLIPMVKSVLDGAKIPYTTVGEDFVNVFPVQNLRPIFWPSATFEVRFRVPRDRADEAREVLEKEADLIRGEEPPEASDEETETA